MNAFVVPVSLAKGCTGWLSLLVLHRRDVARNVSTAPY